MDGLRLVVGQGECRPGALAELCLRLVAHARAIGLTVPRVKVTRHPSACSRYLTIRDAGGREWLLRISNHRRPRGNGHPTPHFDLVSIDGAAGVAEASGFLDRLARGEIAWSDPTAGVRQPRQRRRAW